MGEIGWYGQSTPAEDRLAAALFGDFIGTYCEVGAYNGVDLSNTYHFYLKGWYGVNCDAHPDNVAALYRNQPDASNIHGAIVAKADSPLVSIYTMPDKPIITGLDMPEWYINSEVPGGRAGLIQIEVPCYTLTTVLERCIGDTLDYLSIDTDGTELDVLHGMDFSRWQPRLMIIEYNHTLREIDEYLTRRGYLNALDNGLNAFYVRTEDDARIIREAANA